MKADSTMLDSGSFDEDPLSLIFSLRPLSKLSSHPASLRMEEISEGILRFLPPDERNFFQDKDALEKFALKLRDEPEMDELYSKLAQKMNIFRILNAYGEPTDINGTEVQKLHFEKDPHYCDKVDVLNLLLPSNLFQEYNIWSTSTSSE